VGSCAASAAATITAGPIDMALQALVQRVLGIASITFRTFRRTEEMLEEPFG
jgi:hypothetical protein